MHKTIIFLSLLLLSFSCTSQFNDSIHHYLHFAATGFFNKTSDGNSYLFNNVLAFNTKKKRVSFNTAVSWIYGAQEHMLSNNDFNAQGYINLDKGIHKIYYWGLLTYDKSYSLKINHRSQVGAGVAYTIIDSPFLKINVSNGILYEQVDLTDAKLGRVIYHGPRNSFRLQYRWSVKDRLMIDGVHFFQPSFAGINDYIVNSSTNVSVRLKKWLSITTAVLYNKVNRTRRDNLLITYGLTIEKFF